MVKSNDDASPSPNQQVALVTGASRGIGAAIAQHLLALGYNVAGTATSSEGAEQIGKTLSASATGSKAIGVQMNLTEQDSIQSCFDTVVEQLGAPAILVNNAGITKDNLYLRMKSDQIDDVLQVNLVSVLKLTKLALKPMVKARWGRVINLSSVVAQMGNVGQVNYAASKAGIEGMTRSLAKEVGSRGITVNAVAPGFIATDMTDAMAETQQKLASEQIPLGRFGSVEEVASLVAYLASAQASYITGTVIPINGGLYLN